jgi:prophage DNA circulation protein
MSDTNSDLPTWATPLQQASWNGIPFQYSSINETGGRRNATHGYPFRDTFYYEDMGAEQVVLTYAAYLVGDDVFSQRETILAAFNTAAIGTLVDPVKGSLFAKVGSTSFNFDVDKGRTVSCSLQFFVTSQNGANTIGPFTTPDTQSDVLTTADDVDDAADSDFEDDVGDTITSAGTAGSVINTAVYAVQAITNTVQDFADQVLGVVNSASRLVNAVEGIGYVLSADWTAGRYALGNLTTAPAALLMVPAGLAINDLVSTATTALLDADTTNRANVSAQATAAVLAVNAGASVPSAVQATTEALRNGCAPSDAIQILSGLASYTATVINSTSPIGAAVVGAIVATAAVSRRAAITSLARACASYQPTNTSDAASVLAQVVPLITAEIAYASSVGDSKTAQSLKNLRTKVIADQNAKASGLQNVVAYTVPGPTPLKVLAMRLYGDATQADGILQRNQNIPHPTFSSLTVEILSP